MREGRKSSAEAGLFPPTSRICNVKKTLKGHGSEIILFSWLAPCRFALYLKVSYCSKLLPVPVLRHRNYLYGSGSDFLQVTVPVPVPVPVPAPASYLEHKKQFLQGTKINHQICCKMCMKNVTWRTSNHTILYCVCENFCDSIISQIRFPLRLGKKLRFLRFRFRNTGRY